MRTSWLSLALYLKPPLLISHHQMVITGFYTNWSNVSGYNQLKGSSRNMRYKLLQKRFTGTKTTECSKHLHHIAIEKDILSELNGYIFQTSLKYIKLVIPKILFILVLSSFNFYFKILWSPTKIKISDSPSNNFSEIFNPHPWAGRGCMLCQNLGMWNKLTFILNQFCSCNVVMIDTQDHNQTFQLDR